jgi:hypothetical protein
MTNHCGARRIDRHCVARMRGPPSRAIPVPSVLSACPSYVRRIFRVLPHPRPAAPTPTAVCSSGRRGGCRAAGRGLAGRRVGLAGRPPAPPCPRCMRTCTAAGGRYWIQAHTCILLLVAGQGRRGGGGLRKAGSTATRRPQSKAVRPPSCATPSRPWGCMLIYWLNHYSFFRRTTRGTVSAKPRGKTVSCANPKSQVKTEGNRLNCGAGAARRVPILSRRSQREGSDQR